MTLEEIDHLLDLMAAEAAEKADDAFLPGTISLTPEIWGAIARPSAGMTCTNILHRIRYRGVQVLVARARENKVLNRAEDGGHGQPYFDLEPRG